MDERLETAERCRVGAEGPHSGRGPVEPSPGAPHGGPEDADHAARDAGPVEGLADEPVGVGDFRPEPPELRRHGRLPGRGEPGHAEDDRKAGARGGE